MKRYWFLGFAALCMTVTTSFPSPSTWAETPHPPEFRARAEAEKPFEAGYDWGYTAGFQIGAQGRVQAQPYEPTVDEEVLKHWPSDRARAGYQAGFLAGYQDGYHNDTTEDMPAVLDFHDGYTDGYRIGLNAGNLCRQHRSQYEPIPTFDKQGTPEYGSGYRVGYWQGFEKGYTFWE